MKTKVHTKKKVSTKPKSKPLKQGDVSGSKYRKCILCGDNSWVIAIDMCYNCEF